MEEKTKKILRNYVSEGEPFGAIRFEHFKFKDDEYGSKDLVKNLEKLFDRHNDIYKEEKTAPMNRPSIVVGRRGAGKTAFIEHAYIDDRKGGLQYNYRLKLPEEIIYPLIEEVEKSAKNESYAENTANLWRTIFLIVFFNHIRNEFGDSIKENIYNYLISIGVKVGGNEENILTDLQKTINDQSNKSIIELNSYLQQDLFGNIKKEVHTIMSEKKQRAIVMLDNPEKFPFEKPEFSKAISGLLKFIGDSNNPDDTVDIRVCIPIEIYYEFRHCSSNELKDFRRQRILHWSIRELFVMAANRFKLYCELYKPELFEKFNKEEVTDFKQAQEILYTVLPREITSSLGVSEHTLPYIGRHTQLLPRHLGKLLNSIWLQNEKASKDMTKPFSEKIVREGVSAAENELAGEICGAYVYKYPNLSDCCKACLKEIQHVFTSGELHTIFNRHGQEAFNYGNFEDFKEMLIEVGAVGIVERETKYIEAVFGYTFPHKLYSRHDDKLCLHPLFSEKFNSRTDFKKSIYPYAADPHKEDDYRERY